MMRRFFTLLLVTPLLASCSDSVTPVSPSGAKVALEESPLVVESPLGPEWNSSAGELPLSAWESAWASPLEESQVQSAPGSGALMYFGHPTVGSNYPAGLHDESFHGRDRVIPGNVTIDAGQAVTFRVFVGHRVAIYKPGKRPEDVVVDPSSFWLDDPTGRAALQAAPVPVISFTFVKPGRDRVICARTTHFVEANMYGWVIVRLAARRLRSSARERRRGSHGCPAAAVFPQGFFG
jgi:plastocyanin